MRNPFASLLVGLFLAILALGAAAALPACTQAERDAAARDAKQWAICTAIRLVPGLVSSLLSPPSDPAARREWGLGMARDFGADATLCGAQVLAAGGREALLAAAGVPADLAPASGLPVRPTAIGFVQPVSTGPTAGPAGASSGSASSGVLSIDESAPQPDARAAAAWLVAHPEAWR